MKISILTQLEQVIQNRKINPRQDSYTSLLLSNDNKIIKKLGEENAELIRAFLVCDPDELAGEAADYLYHMMVALAYRDVPFDKVMDVLTARYK